MSTIYLLIQFTLGEREAFNMTETELNAIAAMTFPVLVDWFKISKVK
jgi:hypothetical protein